MDFISTVVDLFLNLDVHLTQITSDYGTWTYALLFLVIFLETGLVITPFLPGDSLLFAAGALAAIGDLHVGLLFGLLFVAAILGDTVNYAIGHKIGPRAFETNNRFLKKEHLEKTQAFYEKHGGKTIVLARFVPIVRTFAPFVAGVGIMDYRRFVTFNVVGGFLWTSIFIFVGYFFGNLEFVKHNFEYVILAIIGISVLPMVIEFLKARNEKKQVSEPAS